MPDMLEYKLTRIKKKDPIRMPVDDLEKLAQEHFTVKSYVVAYLDYEVFIGIWSGEKFCFYKDIKVDPKYIQKIRIFNKNAELLAWRSSDGLKGRIRIDEPGIDTSIVEAYQALFGKKTLENIGNFTKISEERGTTLILPFSNLTVGKRNRVFIKTRNYIDYNETNQPTYVDCRFMGFFQWNNDCNRLEDMEGMIHV